LPSLLEHRMAIRNASPAQTIRKMQNMYLQVPVDIQTQALREALLSGRLYIAPADASTGDTRAEVISIVSRILPYACSQTLVNDAWQAILADDRRVRSFRLTQKRRAGEINGYRIAAVVSFMLSQGLYDSSVCTFRSLCIALFADSNDAHRADCYRRNCADYALAEDERIVRHLLNQQTLSVNPLNA